VALCLRRTTQTGNPRTIDAPHGIKTQNPRVIAVEHTA